MALGGMFVGPIAGATFGRVSGRLAGIGTGMTGLRTGVGGVMGAGIAGLRTGIKFAEHGSAFTNPMFNNVTGQAYGKRGIDSNRLNTNGLVQSLHGNRRKTPT